MLYGLCVAVYCVLFVGCLSMIGWSVCGASCGIYCWLIVVDCVFVCCPLFIVFVGVGCSLCVVHCSLCVVRCVICDLRCWLLVVPCLLIVGWLLVAALLFLCLLVNA